MAPTADDFAEGSPETPAHEPDPQATDLSRALGAAAQAGQQEYEDPDSQGDIAADDAGGTALAQEINREQALPKGPPGAG
jgi:hypothetical protein